jgi:hypothetical protein
MTCHVYVNESRHAVCFRQSPQLRLAATRLKEVAELHIGCRAHLHPMCSSSELKGIRHSINALNPEMATNHQVFGNDANIGRTTSALNGYGAKP